MNSAPKPALGLSLERRCQAMNRAGAPCRSPVLIDGGNYCAMHSGKVNPRELGRLGGIASMAARQERAKHVRERLQRRVEQRFEEVAGALFDALGSDDERLRVRAATALLAEAYGNPATAIVGDGDKPVTFVLESAFRRPDGDG
jgi:hypothetical protein